VEAIMAKRVDSFEEFWPLYVREHSNKLNRTLHFIGTSLALACVAAALTKRRPWLLLLAPVAGYGFGWAGHFFVEKNRPMSFSHPLYSLMADFVMYWKTLSGKMDAEVERVLAGEHEAPRAETATQTMN
jgi:hypothetical protein